MSKFDFLSEEIPDIEGFMEKHAAYKDLRQSDLDNIPESEIVTAVTSWIEGKFKEDWSDMCEVINGLPTPCLNVYCADYTAKEILGGGFAQAFFNSSRDFIGAAANGFRALGYDAPAEIIENALKANYDSGAKPTGHGIEDFLSFAENDEYAELDEAFRSAFDAGTFCKSAKSYVEKHKKYFGEADS